MESASLILRIGPVQASALEIYVFDPIFDEPCCEDDQQPFPGTFDGKRLVVEGDRDAAWRVLVDAANSADADQDYQLRNALQALRHRVLLAGQEI